MCQQHMSVCLVCSLKPGNKGRVEAHGVELAVNG